MANEELYLQGLVDNEFKPLSEKEANDNAHAHLVLRGLDKPTQEQIAQVVNCLDNANEVISAPYTSGREANRIVLEALQSCAAEVVSQNVPNHSGKNDSGVKR